MVKIPRSSGVQARPIQATPTVRQPINTNENAIARGVGQLGSAIAGVSLEAIKRQEEEQRKAIIQADKDKKAYETGRFLQYKNQLRRFDNQEKISLQDAGINEDVLLNSKKDILDRRKGFIDDLKVNFADSPKLLELIEKENSTSSVELEFSIDKDLSKKRKIFGKNTILQSFSDLKDSFETAQSEEEVLLIANQLKDVQETGIASGLITFKDIDRIQKDFEKARKEREQDEIRRSNFELASRGEIILDPKDKDEVNLINEAFEEYYSDSPDILEKGLEIAKNTGIIPDVIKSNLTTTLLAGNNKQKIESAQQIVNLQRQNPSLQSQFTDRERSNARAIASRTNIGLSDEQIIQFAETDISKNKEKQQLVRISEFDFEVGKSGKKFQEKLQEIDKELKDRSDTSLFDTEVDKVPEEIKLDIIRTAKDFYINQGNDIEDSIEEATDTVLSNWGITEIGGKKRYQKYSPEVMYPNFTKEELKSQVRKEAIRYTPKSIEEIDKQLRLLPIPDSLNTDRPSYTINIEDENGIIDVIRDENNKPRVFTPDITKTKRFKESIKQRESLKFTQKRKAELEKEHKEANKKVRLF